MSLVAAGCGHAAPRAASEPNVEISQREAAIAEFLAALNDLEWLKLADITPIRTFEEFVGRGTEGLLVGEFSGKSTVETGVDPSFPWDEETKGIAGAFEPVQRSILHLELSSATSNCEADPTEIWVSLDLGFGGNIGARELDRHPILRNTERLEGVQVLIPMSGCTAPDATAQMMILAPASDSQATAGSEWIDLRGATFSAVVFNAQKYWSDHVEHRFPGGLAEG